MVYLIFCRYLILTSGKLPGTKNNKIMIIHSQQDNMSATCLCKGYEYLTRNNIKSVCFSNGINVLSFIHCTICMKLKDQKRSYVHKTQVYLRLYAIVVVPCPLLKWDCIICLDIMLPKPVKKNRIINGNWKITVNVTSSTWGFDRLNK